MQKNSMLVFFHVGVCLLLGGCGDPDLVDYIYKLKPGMTQKEVEKILPAKYKEDEKKVNPPEYVQCLMSDRAPVKYTFYSQEKGMSGYSPLSVYYDKNDVIVGFDYGSSGSPGLELSRIKSKLLSEEEVERKGLRNLKAKKKWFAHLERLDRKKLACSELKKKGYCFDRAILRNAIMKGDIETVRLFLDAEYPPDKILPGFMPVHSIKDGPVEIDKKLGNAVIATVFDSENMQKALAANPGMDREILSSGITPLKLAIICGNLEMVKVLVEHGAKIDESILSCAKGCKNLAGGEYSEVYEYLMKNGPEKKGESTTKP